MFYTNKAVASGKSIPVLHYPAPGWHHLPSLLSHASGYLPSHPFQTIPHSHFATFLSFYSCYSQLGVSVSPYLFMEILKFFSLTGQLQCTRCSAGRQKLKEKDDWLWFEWSGWGEGRGDRLSNQGLETSKGTMNFPGKDGHEEQREEGGSHWTGFWKLCRSVLERKKEEGLSTKAMK